jgi:hypothetical protein
MAADIKQSERKEFERWIVINEAPLERPREILWRMTSGQYSSEWTQSLWQSWQAACASKQAEIDDLHKQIEELKGYESFPMGWESIT